MSVYNKNKYPSNLTGSPRRQKSTENKDEHAESLISPELRGAIQHMVTNISKSFIVAWYTNISQTNHDFVASCDILIENAMTKFAELCVSKLDKYRIGQLVVNLIHDHVLDENLVEKKQSIEDQIDRHEYDICQNSVIRLFGLLSSDELQKVIFTLIEAHASSNSSPTKQHQQDGQIPKSSRDYPPEYTEKYRTTSALYTLVIAMLTKAAFMPIIDTISSPRWLYAVIIWLCKKEERDELIRELGESNPDASTPSSSSPQSSNVGREFQPACLTKSNTTTITVTDDTGQNSKEPDDGGDMLPAINFENPVCDSLKRPLDNIEIFGTEDVKGNNSCYTLYCISYDGLVQRNSSVDMNMLDQFNSRPIIDKRNTASNKSNPRNKSNSSFNEQSTDLSMQKSYRAKMTIKRRFREFVILQLRLEENPKIRPYLKNIPKPTKLKAATQSIFSLPGMINAKLDKSTIKTRQRFLERFLIALNNSPFIANSYEFKEFFSYNQNTVNTISKSKSLILQVNLNKVFVDSVKSAYSMIKASLPGDDRNLNSGPVHNPDAWLAELQQSTMKLHVQTRTNHNKMSLERAIDSKLSSMNDSPIRQKKSSSLGRYADRNDFSYQFSSSRGGSLKARQVKSQSMTSAPFHLCSAQTSRSTSSNSNEVAIDKNSSSTSRESLYYDADDSTGSESSTSHETIGICDGAPIATKLIDVFHYSLNKDPNCNDTFINFLVRILLGKTIESYMVKLLNYYVTLDTSAYCINGITSSIWDESDDPPLDLDNANLDEAVTHLGKLIERLINYKGIIPIQILHSFVGNQTRFYLSQLSSQKRNKFVIYSFIANLLKELEATEGVEDGDKE